MKDNSMFKLIATGLLAMWSLLLILPMWFILLFTILNALGPAVPVYAWVLYWTYVPASLIGASASTLLRLTDED